MNEVILYAAIATLVCVMLYSVLGKTTGQGSEDAVDPLKFMSGEKDQEKAAIVHDESDMGIPGLSEIMTIDREFSPSRFLDGAKGAYGMILEAFAEGDRGLLKDLLSASVYDVYDAAITAREEQSLTQVTDLARLKGAEIISAEKDGAMARVSVRYEAELSSALLDADGHVVEGDPDLLSGVSEVWTFERKFKSKDPNWLLSDVAPSEGDALEADPTPDTQA